MIHRLQLFHARKAFGRKEILKNVSLELSTGEILGVFGKNGCGKSTLLKILFGTLRADALELELNNEPITPKEVIPSQITWLSTSRKFSSKTSKSAGHHPDVF